MISPESLSDLSGYQLLDVRLADDYEAAHLAGAESNCVFEVAFGNRLKDTAPDTSVKTVVYGADGVSAEASMAAEKLKRLGYADIAVLEGGIEAAVQAGMKVVKGNPIADSAEAPSGHFPIDLKESRVEWLGRNLINKHWGTIPIKSGHLTLNDGAIVGGEFEMELKGMKCADLEGSPMHDVLIDHLHSDDFLDVASYPRAHFAITSASLIASSSPGSQNVEVTGDLTMRGKTNEIGFRISAGMTAEGVPAAQAAFSIDRTRWGMIYGSGSFFKRLAGHLVNDMIEFQVRILTKPPEEN